MYMAGISVRRVEDITEALWGTRVSPSTVSNTTRRSTSRSKPGGTGASEGEHRSRGEPYAQGQGWYPDRAPVVEKTASEEF